MILLVEDSASAAAITTSILERDGHHVHVVPDGLAALEAIEAGSFDIVVTDWILPRMDGLALCNEIRRRRELAGLYVIFLTVKGETDQLLEGFAAGADDYVPKPFHPAELLARVRAGLRIVALQQERVRAEAERERFHQQHLERVEEANRLKEEFVGLVSHELRTPLTSILGYLEVVLDREAGDLTDEQEKYLTIIARNASRLLRLVGDLLFVAQLEAGKLTLEREEVDLIVVAQEAIEAARPQASEKAIELSLHAPATPPLRADRTRLAQLVDNLVSNAIKFTPEGGRVEVRLADDNNKVALSVADSGMGISKAEQTQLFERFFRTEAATAQAIQGTGLGLTITKAIAEAHGGSIEVQSEEGHGATFVVRLPR